MNLRDISTQLLYTTVPIFGFKSNNEKVSGTGFVFAFKDENDPTRSMPFLITNHHVLEGVVKGFIEFAVHENGVPIKGKSTNVEFDHTVVTDMRVGELDIVAIPIAAAINDLANKGINVFFTSVSDDIIPNWEQVNDLAALEEITFIGYPSGLYDSYNVSPIIRRGITATPIWNDFKGEKMFLIDAGVFPGSSGSPVFIFNQGSYSTRNGLNVGSRILFVGVLTQSIVRNDQTFIGLGKVISSLELIKHLRKHKEKFTIK